MGAHAWIGLLDRIAVHSDVDQLADSVTLAIGFGIISGIMAFPVIEVTGSLIMAGVLFVLSLLTVKWLGALIIRRVWCECHPYLPLSFASGGSGGGEGDYG